MSKPDDLPAAPAPSALGQMAPPAPGSPAVTAAQGEVPDWQAPAEWQTKAPGVMRKASFSAGPNGEVDISVTAFPGDVGGDLANVNRWRRQIGLGPIDEAALASETEIVSTGELSFKLVDLQGAEAATLAAWTQHEGESWFFKSTGPKPLVAAERERFETFLKSVKFHP